MPLLAETKPPDKTISMILVVLSALLMAGMVAAYCWKSTAAKPKLPEFDGVAPTMPIGTNDSHLRLEGEKKQVVPTDDAGIGPEGVDCAVICDGSEIDGGTELDGLSGDTDQVAEVSSLDLPVNFVGGCFGWYGSAFFRQQDHVSNDRRVRPNCTAGITSMTGSIS